MSKGAAHRPARGRPYEVQARPAEEVARRHPQGAHDERHQHRPRRRQPGLADPPWAGHADRQRGGPPRARLRLPPGGVLVDERQGQAVVGGDEEDADGACLAVQPCKQAEELGSVPSCTVAPLAAPCMRAQPGAIAGGHTRAEHGGNLPARHHPVSSHARQVGAAAAPSQRNGRGAPDGTQRTAVYMASSRRGPPYEYFDCSLLPLMRALLAWRTSVRVGRAPSAA